MIERRTLEISKFLEENQAMIIFDDSNRFYFTGMRSSAGVILITKEAYYLFVDFRYFEKAKNSVKGYKTILLENLYSQLKSTLEYHKIKTLFVETDIISLVNFNKLKENLSDFEISDDDTLSKKIKSLRSIKSSDEIDFIKSAQAITDKAFLYILNHIKAGVTEREVALDLEFFMRKNLSEGVAFETIVVSGKNSSMPHGQPSDKKIENGDFVTMDFGAVSNGYCSDMTRTIAISNVTEKQSLVYETVLKAQKEAILSVKANIKCCEVDKVARDIIYNKGYKNCFGHATGHSLGIDIHENPAFSTKDNTILKSGMVMTVEPGIYIENEFGVRIEDMVLVTENGCENLTAAKKELIIL